MRRQNENEDVVEVEELMPYVARKRGRRWAIVNRDTGKVAGYSLTKAKAERSARARNAAGHHGVRALAGGRRVKGPRHA